MDKTDIIRTRLNKLYDKVEKDNYTLEDLVKIEKLESILERLIETDIQSLEKKRDGLKDIICMGHHVREDSGLFDKSNHNLGFGTWRIGDDVEETEDSGLFNSNSGFGIYRDY